MDARGGSNHRRNGHAVFGSGNYEDKDSGDGEDGESTNKEMTTRGRLISTEIASAFIVMVTSITMM